METKVLIVEDDAIIAKDISSLLQSEGYTVVGVAHDGLEALDMLASRQPDFVLLDIYLGTGMSGIEVAEIIQTNYQLPFIFLTSFSDKETLAAAAEQGPYGYLVKPFQDRTLLSTISLALSNFQRTQDAQQNDFSNHIQHLTQQEQKLVASVLKGHSYKEIAGQNYISVNTVKYHLKNIYTKMEVSSRAELLAKLIQ